jgi:hypothetical protein
MGKINEISQNFKQSFDGNDFKVNILPDKVIIDSEKKVIEINNTLLATNLNINGVSSVAFTSAEKEKLNKISTPMQVVGRVDSVELLPTGGVVVGSVYLVGLQDSTDFEEFVCTEVSPEVKYESVGKPNAPQIQSDWNQLDSESPDFLKNKPFYEDIVDVLVLPDNPVNGTMYFEWGEIVPVVGKSYSIEYDIEDMGILVHHIEIGIGASHTQYSPEGVRIVYNQGQVTYNPNSFAVEGHNVNGKIECNPNLRNYRLFYSVMQKLDAKYIDGYMAAGTGAYANKFNKYDENVASGECSHAEGYLTSASGDNSHAEGGYTKASGNGSHAEGSATTASGNDSHAEGYYASATGFSSHAEGNNTTASGEHSHAEGNGTTASGTNSHAEGIYTTANHKSQHVFGEANIADPSTSPATARGNYVEIVGNGTNAVNRSNARTLDWNGNEVLAGGLTCGGNIIASGTNINEALGRTQGFSGVKFRVISGSLQVCIDGFGAAWKTITLV